MDKVALVTGASRGLGAELARFLSGLGHHVVVSARHRAALEETAAGLPGDATVVDGDVADAGDRDRLVAAVRGLGRLDLLVNNASELGPSPLPALADHPLTDLRGVMETNLVAPIALVQSLLPLLRASHGLVVNISSDAARGGYEGWGGYGASKAALDLASLTLAHELNGDEVSVVSVDPGDMRTEMHQAAFPGEDISDRAQPESVVPALLRLLDSRPAPGRYRAQDLLTVGADA